MTKKSKTSKPNDKAPEKEVVIQGPTLYMRTVSNKAFLRREFLNDASSIDASFVLATVTNSYQGQFVDGFNALVLCDSSRIVCLEFPLRTPQARNASLYKIGILLGTLERFRDSLVGEVRAIESAGEEAAQ